MTLRSQLRVSIFPPEPTLALSRHVIRAASELHALPHWLERYPLGAMSSGARQVSWAAARRLTSNPDHGFALAERVPAEAVGSLWALYEAAPSLAVIHESYQLFSGLLLDDIACSIERLSSSVHLLHQAPRSVTIDRAAQDFRAAMQLKTWRRLHSSDELCPLSVHFTYPRPASTRAHELALGTANLRFLQPTLRLELSSTWWDAELPTSNPKAFAELLAHACEAAHAQHHAPIHELVESLFTELLSRDPTAHAVAGALGIGLRTLRRRLSEGGHSLRALLQRSKIREAELFHEIEQIGVPLSGGLVARLLGFANTGALRNARRRWPARACGQI